MNKLAQGISTAAQDSNLGPLSRESEALPLGQTCFLSTSDLTVQGKTNVINNAMWRRQGCTIISFNMIPPQSTIYSFGTKVEI